MTATDKVRVRISFLLGGNSRRGATLLVIAGVARSVCQTDGSESKVERRRMGVLTTT
jgi:hypothetical protein